MPNNWNTYKLGELSTLGDGAHSKVKRMDKGILYLTSKNFKGGSLKLDKIDYISENDYNRLFSSNSKAVNKPSVGDILIGIIGTLGNAYLYKENDKFGISSSVAIIRPDHTKLDSQYLYYCITENKFKNYQNAHNGASVQGYTNLPSLRTIPINLPSIEEQQSIASILSAIDEKIENNLAINKTLEEMAMALYKHWFVDFRPFQDGEFVESELGLIPKGWEVKKITELIEVKDGTHDSPKRVDEGCFLITSKHMTGNIIDFSTAYKISQDDFTKINKRSLVEKGDILMTMIGTVGNFYFVNEEPNYVIKNIGLFKTSKSPIIQSYLYSYFKSKIGQEYIKTQMTGSTQQYVTLNTLRNFDIIVPNEKILTEFNQITNDYFETIMNRTKENQSLTQLRDTLLPQLISGAVRLKEFRE